MTKAITTAAGMQLVEQGKLARRADRQAAADHSPQVLEGLTPAASQNCARKPITLRLLMTHTAGFAYDMWNGDMGKYMEDRHTRHLSA
jgi:CubicO group peptidase (beta-lactamase class C family)